MMSIECTGKSMVMYCHSMKTQGVNLIHGIHTWDTYLKNKKWKNHWYNIWNLFFFSWIIVHFSMLACERSSEGGNAVHLSSSLKVFRGKAVRFCNIEISAYGMLKRKFGDSWPEEALKELWKYLGRAWEPSEIATEGLGGPSELLGWLREPW